MGSFTFDKAFSSLPLYGGCGPKGITCYGNRKMVAVFEETGVGGPVPGNPQRLIYSPDDGVSWAEGDPYYSQYNLWWYRALSPATDRVLVGNAGPNNGVLGGDAVIALSGNGALDWGSASPGGFDPTGNDYWFTDWIEQCGGDRVLAAGWFHRGASSFNLLVSNDGGLTFTPSLVQAGEYDPSHLSWGAYCGDGVVFLSGIDAVYDINDYIPGRPLWRSLDNGDTWTRQQLVSTIYPTTEPYGGLSYVAYLGGTRVLALAAGIDLDTGEFYPLAWISSDLGDTWTEISDRIVASGCWSTDLYDFNYPQWAAGWGDGSRIVIGIFLQPGSGTCPTAILSEDAGQTWTPVTVPAIESGQSLTELGWGFIGKGDDGSLSATLYRLNGVVGGTVYPAMSIEFGAVSGSPITAWTSAPLFSSRDEAIGREIRVVGSLATATVVGYLDSSHFWVSIQPPLPSTGPFASASWYLRSTTVTHWDIWHGIGDWDMGSGPCGAVVPPPTPLPGPGGATPTGPCPQADLIYERRGI